MKGQRRERIKKLNGCLRNKIWVILNKHTSYEYMYMYCIKIILFFILKQILKAVGLRFVEVITPKLG